MAPYNLVAFAQGTSFTFLLCSSLYFLLKSRDRVHHILGWTLGYWFILATQNLFFIALGVPDSLFMWRLSNILGMTAVPLSLVLMAEIMHIKCLTWKYLFFNELPIILLIIIFIIIPTNLVYNTIIGISCVYLICAMAIMGIKAHRYQIKLKEAFSYIEIRNIKWLRKVIISFTVLSFIWIYSCLERGELADVLFSFGLCCCWAIVCYFIKDQRPMIEENRKREILDAKSEDATMPGEDKNSIEESYKFGKELCRLFEEKNIFLESKLTLNQVALQLNTNRTYLSDYLNRVMNTNFYDYVNEYRIEYAAALLQTDSTLTLEVIAEKSGFNSLSTFRRTFLKRYGCTPHYYRKNPNEII